MERSDGTVLVGSGRGQLQQLLLPLLCCLGIQASWFVVLIGLERLAEPRPKPALLRSPLRT